MTEPTRYRPREDFGLETPEDDAAEQRHAVDDPDVDDHDDRVGGVRGDTPLEVDPADAADQGLAAGADEDDYR